MRWNDGDFVECKVLDRGYKNDGFICGDKKFTEDFYGTIPKQKLSGGKSYVKNTLLSQKVIKAPECSTEGNSYIYSGSVYRKYKVPKTPHTFDLIIKSYEERKIRRITF